MSSLRKSVLSKLTFSSIFLLNSNMTFSVLLRVNNKLKHESRARKLKNQENSVVFLNSWCLVSSRKIKIDPKNGLND